MEAGPLTLDVLFDRCATRAGSALAVKDATQACTYAELAARAGALARRLREQGLEKGDPVVIYAERAVHTVVAVVAVLKAGGAFVPVSLDTPPARLDSILEDARARLLLVDHAGRRELRGREPRVATMAIDGAPSSEGGIEGPAVEVTPDDLAYVIYTSGTSGRPKGILIEHGSVARRFHDWDRLYGLSGSPCRCLQVAKLGFDVFVGDLVKALCSGGVLVICPGEAVLDPARLYRWLVDEAIDYVDMVPAVLRELVEYLEASGRDLAVLRMLNCGADVWTKEEYERSRRVTRVARLFSSYGVTECTVENTVFEDAGLVLAGKSTLPIGRALDSDEIVVLDESLAPVAPGVTGQLCIGGPCVARGYLHRPELDQRAFFWRTGRHGERVRFYQTGDLGRVDADGVFEFLGRMDSQVKLNGQRIELEEIERALERSPEVRQAVVCFDGERRTLTAFVRAAEARSIEPSALAAHLARVLPPYMVPSRIVATHAFPLNQNGKVDRARLAAGPSASPHALKSGSHDLHRSRSAADLRERLRRRDIDLVSLVNEFVKPRARFGLLIGGALAEGTATEASPLELLVLLDGADALKRRKPALAGRAVEYLPAPGPGARARLFVEGVEIHLEFLVDGGADRTSRGAEMLSRVDGAWTVHGLEVVADWRRRHGALGA